MYNCQMAKFKAEDFFSSNVTATGVEKLNKEEVILVES